MGSSPILVLRATKRDIRLGITETLLQIEEQQTSMYPSILLSPDQAARRYSRLSAP